MKLMAIAVAALCARMASAAAYDVAAYVWPAYQPEPRWAELGIFNEGIGEWQNVKEAVPKWEGHRQPLVPLWGYENDADPKVMERKIDAAVSHGVNVFIYDWYWYGGRPFLEDALNKGFLGASNNGRMKFYIMWANHDVNSYWNNKVGTKDGKYNIIWPAKVTDDDWRHVVDRWIAQYFKRTNYYKIGGKPVLSIYDVKSFIDWDGLDKAKERVASLRERVRAAGFPGLHLQIICGSSDLLMRKDLSALGIDSATCYCWIDGTHKRLGDRSQPELTYSEWGELALKMHDDCCDLALTMQAHGMLAFLHNRGASAITVLAEDTAVANAALAVLAAARAADLAGIDRSAVRVQFPGERSDEHTKTLLGSVQFPGERSDEHTKTLLGSLAEALGCTVSDAGQPPFANPAEALVNPVDMTELALGVSDFPLDLSMQYAVNSQLVRSFVPLILARAAQTAEDGQLCAALEPIIAHSDPLHVPEHDHYAARGFADIAPTEVEDFFIDGFLRAQYRPSKSFRLAQCAFGSKYSDRELLMWMRTFYGRFLATQFMRHDLPDGPRIGSAGLALRDGFMMPTYAQGALWLDEVDALLARIGE